MEQINCFYLITQRRSETVEARHGIMTKIGRGDVAVRLKKLQTGNPHKLTVEFQFNGGAHLEDPVQKYFTYCRIETGGTEWFALTQAELVIIKNLCRSGEIPDDPYAVYPRRTQEGLISLRDLHQFLRIRRDFRHWSKDKIKQFDNYSRDFRSKRTESSGGRPGTDYQIPFELAEHIAVSTRTVPGHRVRQYLLDLKENLRAYPELIDWIGIDPHGQFNFF